MVKEMCVLSTFSMLLSEHPDMVKETSVLPSTFRMLLTDIPDKAENCLLVGALLMPTQMQLSSTDLSLSAHCNSCVHPVERHEKDLLLHWQLVHTVEHNCYKQSSGHRSLGPTGFIEDQTPEFIEDQTCSRQQRLRHVRAVMLLFRVTATHFGQYWGGT